MNCPMTNEYDYITAYHYRVYRPPLHGKILNRCLGKKEKFAKGLDIGSGTGHSSLALTNFCHEVIGVEPRRDMRHKALTHPQVKYMDYANGELEFNEATFDIVTFAGSLFYAKSQLLLDEVVRVAQPNGLVVAYDFELCLDDVLDKLNIKSREENFYNHEENFSGLVNHRVHEISKNTHEMETTMKTSELVHVLLSVKTFYLALADKHGISELHEKITGLLNPVSDQESFTIRSKTFHTTYRIVK